MKKCWRKYASERPRFEEICQYLDNIIEDMKRDSYCESDSDDGETLSREGSKRFPTRSPSIKSGNLLPLRCYINHGVSVQGKCYSTTP